MSDNKVILNYDGNSYEYPIIESTIGDRGIDISKLRDQTGLITLDLGYKNTGATLSDITSVSYTHLDVYKRQQYGNNNFSSWYYPSKNFIEYQGNMYSMKYGASNEPRYFVKFDGTTITLSLIHI